MRILIVEDTCDLADAIARRLRKLGHAVDTVEDGEEADELLRRERSHEVEFVTIMHFDDQAALHTFDHLDGSAEGVPPEARTLLAHFDSLSSHYRTVAVRAGGHTT